MTKKINVYLSGPIDGVDPAVANHWRDQVELTLPVDVFECLNPMSWARDEDTPLEYFVKDVEQLERADVLLVNVMDEPLVLGDMILGEEPHEEFVGPLYGPLRGTTWEIGWSYARDIPIYLVYKNVEQRDRLGPFVSTPTNIYNVHGDLDLILNVLQSDAEMGVFNEPDFD